MVDLARLAALEKLIEQAQSMDGVVAAGDEIAEWVAGLDRPGHARNRRWILADRRGRGRARAASPKRPRCAGVALGPRADA